MILPSRGMKEKPEQQLQATQHQVGMLFW